MIVNVSLELAEMGLAELIGSRMKANGPVAGLLTPSTLMEQIEAHVHRHPYDIAIVAGSKDLSWEALIKQSREYAAALKTRGVRQGTLVAVRMEPRIETAACCLGLLLLRAVVVPVPVTADALAWARLSKSINPELCIAAKGYLRPGFATWSFEALAAAYIKLGELSAVDPQDIACAVLSSSAKDEMTVVSVDHQTVARALREAAEAIKLNDGDVLQILPADGSVEAWSDLMMGLCAGARTVLCGEGEDARLDSGVLGTRRRYLVGSYSQLSAVMTPASGIAGTGRKATTVLCREGRLNDAQRAAIRSKGVPVYSIKYESAAGGPVAVGRMERIRGAVSRRAPARVSGRRLEDTHGEPTPPVD